jgi:hypothetical protein
MSLIRSMEIEESAVKEEFAVEAHNQVRSI